MQASEHHPFTIPLARGPVAAAADRVSAVVVVAAAAAVVVALWRVAPDERGFGTHERLGLSPCSWPVAYGIPCPTCGCTTAACLLVHGRVVDAVVAQPFGAIVTAALLLLGLHALACLAFARSFVDLLVRLPLRRLLAAGFVALLLGWFYKYLVLRA